MLNLSRAFFIFFLLPLDSLIHCLKFTFFSLQSTHSLSLFSKMAKLVMLMVLCILPAIAMAARRPSIGKNTLVVEGYTYCDTCKFGFETVESSHFIPGATVKLVCKDRKTMEEMYRDVAVSDKQGKYKFVVHEDHKDELCDVYLVKSSDESCSKISKGREQSRVILNHYSGIASQMRYANNMGFEKENIDVFCSELIKKYQVDDDEV